MKSGNKRKEKEIQENQKYMERADKGKILQVRERERKKDRKRKRCKKFANKESGLRRSCRGGCREIVGAEGVVVVVSLIPHIPTKKNH